MKDSYEVRFCEVVIINNKKFYDMLGRAGSDKDALGLNKLFTEDLGCLIQRHTDPTTQQM